MRLPRTALTILALCCLTAATSTAQSYYVDNKGVLRESGNRNEVSFFGVNYTMPFAHAYRAADYLGFDRREAIDKDVYHFARLGFNAYRIHIWDVEISDAEGNLLDNDHLDLLDYLMAKLYERDIKVLVTAMTNFGNGYPERNMPTGGFSYLYNKCDVHTDPEAIKAQQRYISQLITHVNPYTGKAYKDEESIVGFEINNEPCHAAEPSQTGRYIDAMLESISKTGNRKPVFYNVSHNMEHVPSYYKSAVQGTTYQWYPIGLVAGHTRKGNFLPYVDSYYIPFADTPGFAKKAKAVYEFDSADIMYSYMYPAIVRTFRSDGFQWITQFAYDPTDMAQYNTEYQTHYLNLAYTPSKALSMLIAAEAAYNLPRGKQYPRHPGNMIFGDFRVSYAEDLSEMNTPEKFLYSNNTATSPVSPGSLTTVAGYGYSPVVEYEGTGVYFLDRLADGVWRLEVMPDAVLLDDPFAKPSLSRQTAGVMWNSWPMNINLPDLGEGYAVTPVVEGSSNTTADKGTFAVSPGVYILARAGVDTSDFSADTKFKNMILSEFAAPKANVDNFNVVHASGSIALKGKPFTIEASVAGPSAPDSLVIYNDKVSFWREHNPGIAMTQGRGLTYNAQLPAEWLTGEKLSYNIVVYKDGHSTTFPQGVEGMPLDWDFTQYSYYDTPITDQGSPVNLLSAAQPHSDIEVYTSTEGSWGSVAEVESSTGGESNLRIRFRGSSPSSVLFVRKNIKGIIDARSDKTADATHLCLRLGSSAGLEEFSAGFITADGFSYSAAASLSEGVVRIPLSAMEQGATALLPTPFPTFLKTEFIPDINIAFELPSAEILELRASVTEQYSSAEEPFFEVSAVWIE